MPCGKCQVRKLENVMSRCERCPLVSLSSHINPNADLLRTVTPDEYRSRISEFAGLATGEGEIHEALAEYLESESFSKTDGSFATSIPSSSAGDKWFLKLYELSLDQPIGLIAKGPANDLSDFRTPDEFYEKGPAPDQEDQAQILFLRGHPSPKWLKAIGSKYQLEPDFLAKHLDFLNPSTAQDRPLFGLPTSFVHTVQLCITTIGSRDCENRVYTQQEIDNIRKQDKADMTLYSSELSRGLFNVGDAVVRHYSTLDEKFFAIEQKVSIHIQNHGKGWVGKSHLLSFYRIH